MKPRTKSQSQTKDDHIKTPTEFFEGKLRKARREGKKTVSLLELQAGYCGYERYMKRQQQLAGSRTEPV